MVTQSFFMNRTNIVYPCVLQTDVCQRVCKSFVKRETANVKKAATVTYDYKYLARNQM